MELFFFIWLQIFQTLRTQWDCKFQSATPPTNLNWFQRNVIRTLITIAECRLLLFLVICQSLKNTKFWHFFLNTGPYGDGNVQTLLLQVSFNFRQNLFTNMLALGEHWMLNLLRIYQILSAVLLYAKQNGRKYGSWGVWSIYVGYFSCLVGWAQFRFIWCHLQNFWYYWFNC